MPWLCATFSTSAAHSWEAQQTLRNLKWFGSSLLALFLLWCCIIVHNIKYNYMDYILTILYVYVYIIIYNYICVCIYILLLCVHIVMMIHECPNTRAASGQCHVRVALLASPLVLSHWTFGAWYTKGWSRDVLSSQPWTFQAWSLCFRLSSTWETRPFAGAGTLGAAWHHNRSDTWCCDTLCCDRADQTVDSFFADQTYGKSMKILWSWSVAGYYLWVSENFGLAFTRLLKVAIIISWFRAASRLLVNHWSFWPGCGCMAICLWMPLAISSSRCFEQHRICGSHGSAGLSTPFPNTALTLWLVDCALSEIASPSKHQTWCLTHDVSEDIAHAIPCDARLLT